MAKSKHRWQFASRFRAGQYSWNGTAKAKKNLKAAVSEIKKVAKTDPEQAAEGATRLLEKLVPSIEGIDGSSGAIGTAVNKAVQELAPIVGGGSGTPKHEQRVERVFEALQDDGYGYFDGLADEFVKVCGNKGLAEEWGLRLSSTTRNCFLHGGYFAGTSACLACLLAAERYQELEALLDIQSSSFWPYEKYRVMAWAQKGQIEEAIRRTESMVEKSGYSEIVHFLEDLLIGVGRWEEAFERFGPRMRSNTYLASFRETARKYRQLPPEKILQAYLNVSRGQEGKWFATARSLGLNDLALELARRGPCEPQTILNGSRDLAEKEPELAFRLALAAIDAYLLGWAYEYDVYEILIANDQAKKLAATQALRQEHTEFLARRKARYGERFPRLFQP